MKIKATGVVNSMLINNNREDRKSNILIHIRNTNKKVNLNTIIIRLSLIRINTIMIKMVSMKIKDIITKGINKKDNITMTEIPIKSPMKKDMKELMIKNMRKTKSKGITALGKTIEVNMRTTITLSIKIIITRRVKRSINQKIRTNPLQTQTNKKRVKNQQ